MNSTVKFTLTRNVKSPNRGTAEAAGIDFFIPYFDDKFLKDLIKKNPAQNVRYEIEEDNLLMTLMPNTRLLIPSGVRVSIDPQTALIAANKSGVSTKKGLVFTAQVVDSDYDGEMHIGVANISDKPVTIKTGEKLMQFVHTPILLSNLLWVDESIITADHQDSARGDRGFGDGTGNA